MKGVGAPARKHPDPSLGWIMSSTSTAVIVYEEGLTNKLLTHRAKLYYAASSERMETECKTRGFPMTKGFFLHDG